MLTVDKNGVIYTFFTIVNTFFVDYYRTLTIYLFLLTIIRDLSRRLFFRFCFSSATLKRIVFRSECAALKLSPLELKVNFACPLMSACLNAHLFGQKVQLQSSPPLEVKLNLACALMLASRNAQFFGQNMQLKMSPL